MVRKESDMDKSLTTIPAIARHYGIAEKTIYRRIKEWPFAYKVCGQWRIDWEEAKAWFKKQTAANAKGRELSTDNRHDL